MPSLGSLVLVLVLGCTSDRTVQQHGLEFTPVSQGGRTIWLTKVTRHGGVVTLPFSHLPDETSDIPLAPDVLPGILGPDVNPSQVYVSADPETHDYTIAAAAELRRAIEALGLFGAAPVSLAFSEPANLPERLSVVDCSHANATTAVLVVNQGSRNQIIRDGECVRVLFSRPQESTKAVDRLLYGILGAL